MVEPPDPEHPFPCRFGKYLLLDRIADGGMAEIYLAVEDTPHAGRRFVSIKRIRSDEAADPDYVDFFITEGRISLQCTHPNLPQAFELDRVDGLYYLAMEYIEGHTLLDLLRGAIRARERPALHLAVAAGIGVAAALEHVHNLRDVNGLPLRVVHRDVTPQNIMISSAGAVKLIDFGIVRSAIQLHQTAAGIVKGKFAYMSPEQLAGTLSLDHRADLFTLGIVLWECLAARPLFRCRADYDTIEAVRSKPIPDPRDLRDDVPAPLAALVLQALERDRDRRFQTATEMLTALEEVAAECRLGPSLTRMRREAIRLCGLPVAPVLAEVALPGEPAVAPERAQRPAVANAGLARDPLLLYFLRQSGARLPTAGWDDDEVEPDPAAE